VPIKQRELEVVNVAAHDLYLQQVCRSVNLFCGVCRFTLLEIANWFHYYNHFSMLVQDCYGGCHNELKEVISCIVVCVVVSP
jgi:hypothetical protein